MGEKESRVSIEENGRDLVNDMISLGQQTRNRLQFLANRRRLPLYGICTYAHV